MAEWVVVSGRDRSASRQWVSLSCALAARVALRRHAPERTLWQAGGERGDLSFKKKRPPAELHGAQVAPREELIEFRAADAAEHRAGVSDRYEFEDEIVLPSGHGRDHARPVRSRI